MSHRPGLLDLTGRGVKIDTYGSQVIVRLSRVIGEPEATVTAAPWCVEVFSTAYSVNKNVGGLLREDAISIILWVRCLTVIDLKQAKR